MMAITQPAPSGATGALHMRLFRDPDDPTYARIYRSVSQATRLLPGPPGTCYARKGSPDVADNHRERVRSIDLGAELHLLVTLDSCG